MNTLRMLIDRITEIENRIAETRQTLPEDSMRYDDGSDPRVRRVKQAAQEVESMLQEEDTDTEDEQGA